MSKIIEEYYKSANIKPFLLKQKMEKFKKHADIATEFEYWIQNKKYSNDNVVTIEGYTAQSIAVLSKLLNGEGAFMLLIELRENPAKALARIEKGFKVK